MVLKRPRNTKEAGMPGDQRKVGNDSREQQGNRVITVSRVSRSMILATYSQLCSGKIAGKITQKAHKI